MDKLADITAQGWIMAYFIRSDGERFLLGTGAYDFKSDLQHFQPNAMDNDVVELQGTDGQLLAGQVRRSATQSFDGYVGDSTQNRERIEELRRDFLMFFRKNFFYKTVYIYPNGTAIQRKRGYLVDAPSVPELYQFFPEYHVALNYEDPNYYEYAEDAQGDEIFANILAIALSSARTGGLVWDAIGAVSYGINWQTPATASGSAFQISGIEGAPLTLTEIDGNATQNGTPTPDAPVAVQTVSGEQVVKITGKNLFDINKLQKGSITVTDGVATGTANQFYSSWNNTDGFLNSYPAQLTITAEAYTDGNDTTASTTGLRIRVIYTDTTSDYASWSNSTTSYTLASITTNANKTIKSVVFTYNSSASNIWHIRNIQLELGSTATSYEPYHGQEHTINLGDIELAKIGTYQDRIYKSDGKWYIEKQIGKVVLDGKQMLRRNTSANSTYTYSLTTPFDYKIEQSATILNDYFVSLSTVDGIGKMYDATKYLDVLGIALYYNQKQPTARAVYINSNVQLPTLLASNPTTVYYALATPTTTEITNQTLIGQLNFIANLYGGTNNIMLVGTGAQGEIGVEYMTEVDTDGTGYEWEAGGDGSETTITLDAVEAVRPVWQVIGPATDPTLTNITTGETIAFAGTVPASQTLTVDMDARTATMAGANVFQYITGDWLRLEPGNNRMSYTATGTTEPSTLSWNGVVG